MRARHAHTDRRGESTAALDHLRHRRGGVFGKRRKRDNLPLQLPDADDLLRNVQRQRIPRSRGRRERREVADEVVSRGGCPTRKGEMAEEGRETSGWQRVKWLAYRADGLR